MSSPPPDPGPRPNILWIFGDQHRAQATGYSGDPNVFTPNLDSLAAEGVNFRCAVSGFPLCCPARAAMLTGKYPHTLMPGHEFPFPDNQPTIATILKQHGYATTYIGKWHVDGFKERDGRAAFHTVPRHRRGDFDTWIGYDNNNSQYDCHVHGHRGADDVPRYRLPGYETDALTDLVVAQLKSHAAGPKDRPFFMCLSVQPPHDPYVAPEEFMRRHTPGQIVLRPNVPAIPRVVDRARRQLAGYYAMIEDLDWNIGRIRQALREHDLATSTHIIFFSDHGDMQGSHGQFGKTSPWEESIRIPFIISGEKPFYGRRAGCIDHPINMADIAPTTLGLCGIDKPAWMQGTDFSGCRLPHRALPADADSDAALLQLVVPTMHGYSIDRPFRGVVTRDGWKYVALDGQPWMLHNLNEDPYEQANLAFNSAYWPQRKRLQDRLVELIARYGDSFRLPDIPAART